MGQASTKLLAHEAFAIETVRSLFRGLPAVLFANASVALVFVIAQWRSGRTELLFWGAILLLVLGLRFCLYLRFRNLGHLSGGRFEPAGFNARHWIWIFRGGVVLAAGTWGLAGVLFTDTQDPILLAYMILAIGGLCAGSVTALAPDQLSALIFLFLTPTPTLVTLYLNKTPGALGMALFFLVGILFVVLTTHRASEAMLELYQTRLEAMQSAKALSESEQRWKFALEGAKQAVWEWNIEANRELFTSAKWREMLGYSALDEFDHSIDAWRAKIHPDDGASVDEALRVAFASDASAVPPDRRDSSAVPPDRRDSSAVPPDRRDSSAVPPDRRDSNMFSTVYRYAHRDGSWLWVHSRGIVVARDLDGKPLRMIGTRENITETRALQDQLNHAQRLRTIGQLAGGVAHDFNNNLTAMMMSLDMLSAEPALSSSARQCVSELELMTDRASKITAQLLMFARQQTLQTQAIDIGLAIRRVQSVLARLLGENTELRMALSPQPLWVSVDSALFDQALINLVLNARDAMPDGGHVELRASSIEFSASEVRANPQRRVGRFIAVNLQDNGEGMSLDVQKRLFEPFFTTKSLGQGTGLGLASVHGMVHQHQGWIEVHSEAGKGSLFTLFLPEITAPLRRATDNPDATEQVGTSQSGSIPVPPDRQDSILAETKAIGSRPAGIKVDVSAPLSALSSQLLSAKRILVVEDEPLVRDGVVRMLRHLGYLVFAAEDAQVALRIWEQQVERFDLLLTDLVMPGNINGLSLARQLRGKDSNLPVILMSGYSSESTQAELRTAEDTQQIEFLSKPFDLNMLKARVAKAIIPNDEVAGRP
jgi:signal transduction histidine kinase/CheY-like chemotaxis protein